MGRTRTEKDTPQVDFTTGEVGFQVRARNAPHHPLVRAAKIGPGSGRKVVDATAGLGRDAFLIAAHGIEITAIERSPEMFRRLREALEHARAAGPEFAAIVERITLRQGDSRELLQQLEPDIVFIDPMHPVEGRKARSGRDITLLRDVVGSDPDSAELIQAALAASRRRVIVKWPMRAGRIAGLPPPTFEVSGRSIRYHVFCRPPPPAQEGTAEG